MQQQERKRNRGKLQNSVKRLNRKRTEGFGDELTWVDGADTIGERLGAAVAEISGEEGKPRGEKL